MDLGVAIGPPPMKEAANWDGLTPPHRC